MKKIRVFLIVILVIVFAFCNNNIMVLAENKQSVNENVYAQYSGSTEASWGYKPYCTFMVNKIVNNKFVGRFSASNLGQYSFDEAVSGSVTFGTNSFSCTFTVKFYNNRYYTNITATVDKINGTCECICKGSWHWEDFIMTGTKFNYPVGFGVDSQFTSFSENDMKLCMNLSNAIYGDDRVKIDNPKYSETISNLISDICAKNKLNNDKELILYNTIDSDKDNAAFAITNRVNDDGSIDIFVILRGTLKDEWQGNTEITGTSYDDSLLVHDNFNKGKNSIKTAIELYYAKMLEKSSTINLIITGHSRGAAVANLYAKEATDAQNTTVDCGIPRFDNITAYTFACPNVEKYNSSMESYTNIFNFCFKEDLIPTVPLTNPTYGWNYWKYGQTYVANLSDYNTQVNKKTVSDIQDAFLAWENVNSYYNSYITVLPSFTTLYKFVHSGTGTLMSYSLTPRRCMDIFNLITNLALYDNRTVKLICRAIINRNNIVAAHDYATYNSIINGTMAPSTGDGIFFYCSYDSVVNEIIQDLDNSGSFDSYSSNEYNSSNLSNLILFANQDDNLSILNWNLDDPSTWTGITWNADGNVENIDLSFKNLSGSLDLSNFDSLKKLDVTGNNLTSLNLDNCSSLEEMDCSFNKLTALDLSDCTNLTSVTCCYNYLDTHEGGTLYNTLDDLMFSDCYVNYYPQSVPDNATFNSTELNALKTFANTNNNNAVLNWLDDSGNIDTEKLQNNVLFEYDGSKYRVVAIDISDLDVSGALDLTSLSLLQELYCENTKVTTLNINGCTKLEILHCDNCELESLTLPSNADSKTSSLYDVSCEYNYLDINIFTENIIKYIEFKAGASLNYKKQYINKDISAFDESDYNLLVNFANQRNNNKILDWNLSTPGKWENVSWRFDNTSGKYKLSECHFDFMEVKGNIDVSGCDMLDEVSFSGSKINTVTISGKNLNDSTFYGCSELEAVIIKGGSTIYEGTFKLCPTLQAIYIPSDITEIADNAFENSSNITITGVADSYAQTYANEHNINFKPGAFICGNIVAKENLDDSYQYYYPVEDVSIVYKDEVQSTSDKLGYFVLFSTESGENQYKLEYPYGYNINQTTSITNNEPLIIENPIGLICYDWINDGYINAKDYIKLLDQIKKGSEITGIDDKYFDINKDGKVTEEDWELANNFLNYPNPNK